MTTDAPTLRATTAVVLAAGAGTRMRSSHPKVLHPICGRPMLLHVLHAVREAGVEQIVVVTGHEEAAVRERVDGFVSNGASVRFSSQVEQRGTGHATLQAQRAVRTPRALVVNGDLALITAEQIRAVLAAPPARAVVATAEVPDPAGLGRIVRDDGGGIATIVEEADADSEAAAIREVNLGIYRFDAPWLWATLESLQASPSGEFYLTDAVAIAARGARGALPVRTSAPEGRINVEDRRDLARAEACMRDRIRTRWLEAGVTMRDPASTYIDADVEIGCDTVLEPGTHLRGATKLGGDCLAGPNSVIQDTQTGDGCTLVGCSIEEARLGDRVRVGPYSTIRSGTVLDDDVHVGTHAETKNAHLHRGVQMAHFAYVGDADVGVETNIGAGAITCNFDGVAKHRTVIGERVFIGSDSLLIAPIEIGDGAVTGAGAVVNRSVPAGARVLGHPARQAREREREREQR